MNRFIRVSACAAFATIVSTAAAMAADTPDGTIKFSGGGVAVIAGVHWGGGTLHFQGKDYPLQVSGLSVGEVGANKYTVFGNVYHLKQVSDIEGTYAAVAAAATVGAGAGGLQLKNGAGVLIKAHASSAGLNVKLGPSGVTIKLKK
jgi:hypothetical protein